MSRSESSATTVPTPDWANEGYFGARIFPTSNSDAASNRDDERSDGQHSERSERTVSHFEPDTSDTSPQEIPKVAWSPVFITPQHEIRREIHSEMQRLRSGCFRMLLWSILNRILLVYYSGKYAEARHLVEQAFDLANARVRDMLSRAALWKAVFHEKLAEHDEIPWTLALALGLHDEGNDSDKARLLNMLKKHFAAVDTFLNETQTEVWDDEGMRSQDRAQSQPAATSHGVEDNTKPDGSQFRRRNIARAIMANLEADLKGRQLPQTPSDLTASLQPNLRRHQTHTHQMLSVDDDDLSPSVFAEPPAPSMTWGSHGHVLHLMAKNAELKQRLIEYETRMTDQGGAFPSPCDQDTVYRQLMADVQEPLSPNSEQSLKSPVQLSPETQSNSNCVSQLIDKLRQGVSRPSNLSRSSNRETEPIQVPSSPRQQTSLQNHESFKTTRTPVPHQTRDRRVSIVSVDNNKLTDTPGGARLDGLTKLKTSIERRRSMPHIDTSVQPRHSSLPMAVASSTGGQRLSADLVSSPVNASPLRRSSTASGD